MKRKNPGGRPRSLTETQIARARRLLTSGMAKKNIATALEVSYSTLYLALKPYSAGPYPQMGRPKQAPSANTVFAAEVLKATINNACTKRSYVRFVVRFLTWCERKGVELRQITPCMASQYMDQTTGCAGTKMVAHAALRHFFDNLVTGHAVNPFASVPIMSRSNRQKPDPE
ncbi:MAG: helix-turn-helix domain-containing protein [Candidatus Sulfotelmatobacter sp.]